MENLKVEVKGKEVHIVIKDYTKTQGKSASGKTTIVATTSGNKLIEGTGVYLGLNAYIKE